MAMTLHFADSTEQFLRELFGDAVEEKVLESVIIELYRNGKIGEGRIAKLLGFQTRHEVDAWLAERRVDRNYSIDDFNQDCKTLDELRTKKP